MKTSLSSYPDFHRTIQSAPLVYLFGTGISAALTGKKYSWWKWIMDGIRHMKDSALAASYEQSLKDDDSTQNMIDIVGKVLSATKADGTYHTWMQESFETNSVTNTSLSCTLQKLLFTQDVFATTNYDLLLEQATGLKMLSYGEPDVAFSMLDQHISTHVLHIHGLYDSAHGMDNIIADGAQYKAIETNEGAQFIQNILGTRTLIFVGCGKTTEDGNISRFIQFANEHLKMDREYYFLYRSTESISGMPANIKLIPYGDDYNDLPLFLEDMAQARMTAKIESNPLILRTVYSENKADAYGLSQYYFANEYLKFCGRKVEIAQLLNFLESDRKFSWWAVTGQAGAGKSRLAYELLHHMPKNLCGFFLNYQVDIGQVDTFEPFTDTVIIIDYVKGNEKRVADFVSRLMDKYEPLAYKLRLLFLERDNLLLSGSWFDGMEKAFDVFHRGLFADGEYHADVALRSHRFLYLDDLDADAVLELIGEICSKKGLPNDTYRDKLLQENYARKFEQLKFRPLFLQLYVEAWIANGCIEVDYQNYTDLLEIVMRREQERILGLVDGGVDTCNALLRLIVRANVSDTLPISDIPEFYKDDWDKVNRFVKTHTLSGVWRAEFLQSLLGDAAQEIANSAAVIRPQYPDIIKEYMFLFFTEEDNLSDISQELWENCPREYNLFLSRCILDFHDNQLLTAFIRNASADYRNTNALLVRLALLQNKIVHSVEDGPRLIRLAKEEYGFWCSMPVSENSDIGQKQIQLQGYYYSADQFRGWSMEKEFFEAVQKIAEYYDNPEMVLYQISYLLEFAHDLTEKNANHASEKICRWIEPLIPRIGDEKERKNAWLGLQRENVVHFIGRKKWEQAERLHKCIFSAVDWEDEKQVELYAYICFSATEKCLRMLEWDKLLDFAYHLQDLAEDYGGETRKIYFNDKVHYYYLHAKLISAETVSIGSMRAGIGSYGISVIDTLLEEIEANMMIADFSGLLVGARALKVGMDDSVTDEMVENYFAQAEELLIRYPDSALLAQKVMDLWETSYAEQYKAPVPKGYVERAYALTLRFAEREEVLDQFFRLLGESEEAGHWLDYTRNKQIVNHLIEFGLTEYLAPPEGLFSEPKTVKRTHPKVGANDSCPCGSGRKFKKCCWGNGKFD